MKFTTMSTGGLLIALDVFADAYDPKNEREISKAATELLHRPGGAIHLQYFIREMLPTAVRRCPARPYLMLADEVCPNRAHAELFWYVYNFLPSDVDKKCAKHVAMLIRAREFGLWLRNWKSFSKTVKRAARK